MITTGDYKKYNMIVNVQKRFYYTKLVAVVTTSSSVNRISVCIPVDTHTLICENDVITVTFEFVNTLLSFKHI